MTKQCCYSVKKATLLDNAYINQYSDPLLHCSNLSSEGGWGFFCILLDIQTVLFRGPFAVQNLSLPEKLCYLDI